MLPDSRGKVHDRRVPLLFGLLRRRWTSNPSEKILYERPTRGTVCGTLRSMCGADAGCLAINDQSFWQVLRVAMTVMEGVCKCE